MAWNLLEACLHGGGGPQIGEVTCGGLPHLSCKRDQINMRALWTGQWPHLPGVTYFHVNRTSFDVIWRTWTYDDEFSFLFLNLSKLLKNSTPGKVVCIWHIERVQIDTIKERKCIFLLTLSLPSSSTLLKIPSVLDWKISKHVWDLIFLHNNFIRNAFSYSNFQYSRKCHCQYQLYWGTFFQECFWSRSINSRVRFYRSIKPRDETLRSFIKHYITYEKSKTHNLRNWKNQINYSKVRH